MGSSYLLATSNLIYRIASLAVIAICIVVASMSATAWAIDIDVKKFPTCKAEDSENICFFLLTKKDYPAGWAGKKPGSYIQPIGCNRANAYNFKMEGTVSSSGAKRDVVIFSEQAGNLPPLKLYCDLIFGKIVGTIDTGGIGEDARGTMEAKTGKTQLTMPLMVTVSLTEPSITVCEFGTKRAGGPVSTQFDTEHGDGVRYSKRWGMLDLYADRFKVPGVYTVTGDSRLCKGLMDIFDLVGAPLNMAFSLNPKVPGIRH